MRWLIVTDDWLPQVGGVATFAAAMAVGLVAAGDEVTVAARARHVRRAPDLPGVNQLALRGPSFGRWGGVWTLLQAWPTQGARVLAVTWPLASWLVGRCEVDVVYHGSDLTRPPVDPRGRARVFAQAHRHWVMSRFLGEELRKLGVVARHLPVPIDRVSTDGTKRGWVFAGRATALKGGDRFIRLAHAAGVRATVIGDGPALPEWQALAHSLGASVRFTGRLPRQAVLEELARHAYCFLLPRTRSDGSGAEGLGLTLIEAASVGTIPVGCSTGGVPESAGLVLEDPDDIARSLRQIRAHEPRDPREDWRHGVQRAVALLRAPSTS